MTFWASQQLEEHLPSLIDKFEVDRIDCNAYRLSIGDELYVSPTDQTPDPKSSTIRRLAENEAFAIPPGQFAFLITDERIQIPKNAMAFISIRAKVKLKGLVNVSGFHVDPGFSGRLVFSVFNAGPSPVHLKRGQQCFLIWFANLTEPSRKFKSGEYEPTLSTDLVNALPGELQSLEGLSKKLSETEKKLNERISQLEPKVAELNLRRATLIALLTAVVGGLFLLGVKFLLDP